MKRFFKKASLLLVALVLVAANILPAFAKNIRTVDGVCTFMETKDDLACGNGQTASTYKYCCFTGTYDDDTSLDQGTYFAVRADCRGGYLDTHRTELFICVETSYIDEGANGYYYNEVDLNSHARNSRYLEGIVWNDGDAPKQYLEGYVWMDFTATAGGEDWDESYICDWTPHYGIGWVEY